MVLRKCRQIIIHVRNPDAGLHTQYGWGCLFESWLGRLVDIWMDQQSPNLKISSWPHPQTSRVWLETQLHFYISADKLSENWKHKISHCGFHTALTKTSNPSIWKEAVSNCLQAFHAPIEVTSTNKSKLIAYTPTIGPISTKPPFTSFNSSCHSRLLVPVLLVPVAVVLQ